MSIDDWRPPISLQDVREYLMVLADWLLERGFAKEAVWAYKAGGRDMKAQSPVTQLLIQYKCGCGAMHTVEGYGEMINRCQCGKTHYIKIVDWLSNDD